MERILAIFERPALRKLLWIVNTAGGWPAVILTIYKKPFWAIGTFAGYIIATIIGDFILRYQLTRNKLRMQSVLRKISYAIEKSKTPYHIKKCTYVYKIGLLARGDKREREYSIEALEDEVLIKELNFGAGGENVPGKRSLEDLHLVVRRVSQGEAILIPKDETNPHSLSAYLIFAPVIAPKETRNFIIEGEWQGEWNPLRKEGVDKVRIDFRHEVGDKLEIIVIFPKGIETHNVKFARRPPHENVGELKTEVKGGSLYIIWGIPNPKQAIYILDISCERFSKRRTRLLLWLKEIFSR
jgi:hypothetical protein